MGKAKMIGMLKQYTPNSKADSWNPKGNSLAPVICEDCEKVFLGGPRTFLCQKCRKRRLGEAARKRIQEKKANNQ